MIGDTTATRGEPLLEGVVYISPLGRRCRWVPYHPNSSRGVSGVLLEYVDAPPRMGGERDGFTLSHYNLHLLKRPGGSDAPAR